MRAVKMYIIIVVTLMKTTLGLPKSCLYYCNFPPENSSISPGCDCSLRNPRKTQKTTSTHIATPTETIDSGNYYDPVKMIFSQNTSFGEQTLHMLSINPIFKTKQNTFNDTKKELITVVPFAEQHNYDENISQSSNQYKRSDTYFQTLSYETKEPLHLYLDIDITSENDKRPQLEELKYMFENFQTAEKNLSECLNLHIYIFSQYFDTINKTNTNWGRKVQNDNLSNFQQLTEIQSKCDQPASIIKQSIYQINQFLSREDKTIEFTQDEHDTLFSADSHKKIRTQNATNDFGNMYSATLSIHSTDGNNNNTVTETADIVAEKPQIVPLHKNSEHDDLLFNKYLLNKKNTDITSTSSSYEASSEYDKINMAVTTDSTNYVDLSNTDRTILSEKDMKIPRIITKELSNGTFVSVVDGYEEIPNTDFITIQNHNIASTQSNSESISNSDLIKSNIVPSDIVNIHGNLFFSFRDKQIPARFIQQSDGKLDVAIDGFSMCDQLLEHNLSKFMNSLCKCIVRKNCT